MQSSFDIKAAVHRVLVAARPLPLSADEILERLPERDALIARCRADSGVGARFAAASVVREALFQLGAAVQLSFEGLKGSSAREIRIVYRLTTESE